MTTRHLRHPLAATAAAVLVLLLAGCGGGNNEAPPQVGDNVVNAAAPVLTITNDVSGDVATGAITFTFSFNRDVGTSFTADDITVTGGDKGAFNRTGSTSATLVVVPAAGTTGTVMVSVAAAAVVDAVGTANAASSASKAFNVPAVVVPPPAAGPLNFSTGFAGGNRTVEGGEFGGFSGSNLDGFSCNGAPSSCGAGGEFVPARPAATTYFFYYYQTPTPATALYTGLYVQAPGVVGFSAAADTPGVQVGSQTTLRFKLGQNPEWFNSATNNFTIVMDLGKRYVVGGNTCRLQLLRVVTPTAAAATSYAIPLSSFHLSQDCAVAVSSVAQALAASPISQISFQGVGGSNALTDGVRTSGANRSVAVGGFYPTTVVLEGGIVID